MVFRDFAFPEVYRTLGLTLAESRMFVGVASAVLSADFVERMEGDVAMALAVSTEKARSEFVIAPILSELRRSLKYGFGLFSGVAFDVDASRGLNGYCDFVITRSPIQIVMTAPIIAIVEAKNDNIHSGLGQCIATMYAAREFDGPNAPDSRAVYGVVTTGSAWKFLKLHGTVIEFDVGEYSVVELGRIMGILTHILTTASE